MSLIYENVFNPDDVREILEGKYHLKVSIKAEQVLVRHHARENKVEFVEAEYQNQTLEILEQPEEAMLDFGFDKLSIPEQAFSVSYVSQLNEKEHAKLLLEKYGVKYNKEAVAMLAVLSVEGKHKTIEIKERLLVQRRLAKVGIDPENEILTDFMLSPPKIYWKAK